MYINGFLKEKYIIIEVFYFLVNIIVVLIVYGVLGLILALYFKRVKDKLEYI